jgi:hypothetical protein
VPSVLIVVLHTTFITNDRQPPPASYKPKDEQEHKGTTKIIMLLEYFRGFVKANVKQTK